MKENTFSAQSNAERILRSTEHARILCYIRVSTTPQNIQRQERIHRDYFKKSPYPLNRKTVVDKGYSGDDRHRPNFLKALAQIDNDEDDRPVLIAVSEQSRLMRDFYYFVPFIEKYVLSGKVNLFIVSKDLLITKDSPQHVFQSAFLQAYADHQELINIRIGTKSGLQNAKAKGKTLGRPKKKPTVAPARIKALLKHKSQRETARILNISRHEVRRVAGQKT